MALPRHTGPTPATRPRPEPQKQELPGEQAKMIPEPMAEDPRYRPAGKLAGKTALITGGDSGIGSSVAILFAKEGADVAILYLSEDRDADRTCTRIKELGRRCLKLRGDVGDEPFCRQCVDRTIQEFGKLDILVNNAAEQRLVQGVEQLSAEQLERTYKTNFFGYIHLTKAALPHLQPGSAIINTTSIQAYDPKPSLLDYASTKAAILNFTRALAKEVAEKGIRVNAVAPGPVWTPLIPASFPPEALPKFGKDTPLGRAAQPCEIAPCYVFLASEPDSSYITGQTLHPNGGRSMLS